AQGQFTPRHPLLLVDRLLREMSAFAHSLLIRILGLHGARSDLRTPPLCPLVDVASTGNGRKGSPAEREVGSACARWAGAGANSRDRAGPGEQGKIPGRERRGRER